MYLRERQILALPLASLLPFWSSCTRRRGGQSHDEALAKGFSGLHSWPRADPNSWPYSKVGDKRKNWFQLRASLSFSSVSIYSSFLLIEGLCYTRGESIRRASSLTEEWKQSNTINPVADYKSMYIYFSLCFSLYSSTSLLPWDVTLLRTPTVPLSAALRHLVPLQAGERKGWRCWVEIEAEWEWSKAQACPLQSMKWVHSGRLVAWDCAN